MSRRLEGDTTRHVIRLNDLDPQKDVRGGAGKRVFGELIELENARTRDEHARYGTRSTGHTNRNYSRADRT